MTCIFCPTSRTLTWPKGEPTVVAGTRAVEEDIYSHESAGSGNKSKKGIRTVMVVVIVVVMAVLMVVLVVVAYRTSLVNKSIGKGRSIRTY